MSGQQLVAAGLLSDPRIEQARRLLREAILDHSSQLTGIRPPAESCSQGYSEALSQLQAARGGALFYPYIGSGLGRGSLVELADGSVKYDMITGIGVHVFGHSDPLLAEALVEAVLADTVMQGNLQQNIEPLRFSEELIASACESGAPLRHCFLSTSGAMANENALKMLFQAKHPATRLLAFANNFSGRTLALSQVTDRPGNRQGMPTMLAVDYIPFFDAVDPEGSTSRAVSALMEATARYPAQHAGMVLELIQGEGGYYTAPREFFVTLCQILREQNLPIFFDEIQSFGRTSRLFAFQHFRLDEFADLVTVGKMTQVCATLFRDELVPKPGLVSQTFTGSTASIVAAINILQRLKSGNYFGTGGRIDEIHSRFAGHFECLQTKYPQAISGPWGLGGMIAFTPFGGDAGLAKTMMDRLYAAGVITFSAADRPKRIRMLPPLGAISNDDIDAVCSIIGRELALLVTEE